MRNTRKQQESANTHDVAIRGRRGKRDAKGNKIAPNSLQFLVTIEGVTEYDGRVRGANGIRWKVA